MRATRPLSWDSPVELSRLYLLCLCPVSTWNDPDHTGHTFEHRRVEGRRCKQRGLGLSPSPVVAGTSPLLLRRGDLLCNQQAW